MKQYISLLFFVFLLVAVNTFASESLIVGILENPQCKQDAPRSVRPLFGKRNGSWIALDKKNNLASFKMDSVTWTAAFDGKNIGNIVSSDPKKIISPDWTYPRDYLQVINAGQVLPEIKNKLKQYSGWCEPPEYFPIPLVSSPNFLDPEHWKRSVPTDENKEQLLIAFREATKNVAMCLQGEGKPRPYKYGIEDLKIIDEYKSNKDIKLVSVTLKKPFFTCSSELGKSENKKWFYLDGVPHYLGDDLTLIDAGDYDNDGKSEVIFWYGGYNKDGYVMFYNDFKNKVKFLWSYH
jgi:hypothetical protein